MALERAYHSLSSPSALLIRAAKPCSLCYTELAEGPVLLEADHFVAGRQAGKFLPVLLSDRSRSSSSPEPYAPTACRVTGFFFSEVERFCRCTLTHSDARAKGVVKVSLGVSSY